MRFNLNDIIKRAIQGQDQNVVSFVLAQYSDRINQEQRDALLLLPVATVISLTEKETTEKTTQVQNPDEIDDYKKLKLLVEISGGIDAIKH